MKKYEILKEDSIEWKGRTLYRIRALKNFSAVKIGDLGGYIQFENNLSQYGDCWLYDETKAYDDAHIFENARIFNNVEVCEDTQVFGNAKIKEDVMIYGNAIICDCAKICGDVKISKGRIIGDVNLPFKKLFQHQCEKRILTAILTNDNRILYTIGCQHNISKKVFLDRIYNENGGLEKNPHRKEYLILIPLIEEYFKQCEEES